MAEDNRKQIFVMTDLMRKAFTMGWLASKLPKNSDKSSPLAAWHEEYDKPFKSMVAVAISQTDCHGNGDPEQQYGKDA